ncbi:MAG: dihydroorotase [Methylococcales bacterium]|nr:dihydroorotase [Methylococcales bacterium]
MKTLTLIQPDDWHLHLRNGDILKTVLAHSARQFKRAMIMPNLKSPVVSVDDALHYRQEILQARPNNSSFEPLMSLYLTPQTSVEDIQKVAENPFIYALKLYPAGATTNSASGVNNLTAIYPILEAMQTHKVPLLIHGEVTESNTDIFDRERLFIDTHLIPMVVKFPELKIVLEHVTTKEAVQFVESASKKIAATITPQHLLFNRNALLVGGIKPHYYCLPILKRESHQQALIIAATSGNPKFFLGTDSAPHLTTLKENACGCAGCYSAFAAVELYAEAFEKENALDKLEAFASFYGADFYGVARNTETITLEKKLWKIPPYYGENDIQITPLKANETLNWKQT